MSDIATATKTTSKYESGDEYTFERKSFSLLTTMILATNYWILETQPKSEGFNRDEFTYTELLEWLDKQKKAFGTAGLKESVLVSFNDLFYKSESSFAEIITYLEEAYLATGELIKEKSYEIQGDNSLPNLDTMTKAIESLLEEKVSVIQSKPSKNGKATVRFDFADTLIAYIYGIEVKGDEITNITYQDIEMDAWVPTTNFERNVINIAARKLMAAYYKKSKK